MSVNWSWKHKMGEITLKQKKLSGKVFTYKLSMYSANCLCAITYNFREKNEKTDKLENMYTFWGWWNDVHHLKRCLGLEKSCGEYDNLYGKEHNNQFTKVKLNTYYFTRKEFIQMAQAFTESGIKVELYYKEPKESKSHSTKKGGE